MTQQHSETLRYLGRTYSIQGLPLGSCNRPDVQARMALFHGFSTALWRGYLGTWAIRGGRLWLVELEATVQPEASDDSHDERRDLSWLFPDGPAPILADWFSGELVTGCGKPERSGMYSREYPRMRVFHVLRGVVQRIEVRDNRAAVRAGRKRYAAVLAVLG